MTTTTTTAKVTSKVTLNELNAILGDISITKGMANFATVEQLTEPKLTKKDRVTKEPFLGQIHKLSIVSIILNTEYEKIVTNQLKREDKETSEYKKGVNTMPIEKCDNNNFFGYYYGKGVLEYKPNQGQTPQTAYYLNGKIIDKNLLPDVLPTTNKATNQGTDKEVFWRKLYTKNIVSITLNGVKYEVIR